MIKELSKNSVIHLFKFYLKCLTCSTKEIMDAMYFAVLMIAVFYVINLGSKIESNAIVSIAMFITVLSVIMSAGDITKQEKEDGFLELIYLSGINLYWIVFIKLSLALMISIVITLSVFASIMLMYNIEAHFVLNMLISFILILPSLIVVIMFVNIITIHYLVKVMQYVLSLPLILPLMISAVSSVADMSYLSISLGLNLIYLPLFIFFCRQVLEFAIISEV